MLLTSKGHWDFCGQVQRRSYLRSRGELSQGKASVCPFTRYETDHSNAEGDGRTTGNGEA